MQVWHVQVLKIPLNGREQHYKGSITCSFCVIFTYRECRILCLDWGTILFPTNLQSKLNVCMCKVACLVTQSVRLLTFEHAHISKRWQAIIILMWSVHFCTVTSISVCTSWAWNYIILIFILGQSLLSDFVIFLLHSLVKLSWYLPTWSWVPKWLVSWVWFKQYSLDIQTLTSV